MNNEIGIYWHKSHILKTLKPEDMKVNIWGYELCNGAEWKDFLEVSNKLGEDNKHKDEKIKILEKALKLACEEIIEDLDFESEEDRHIKLQENIEYFKAFAKKELKDE